MLDSWTWQRHSERQRGKEKDCQMLRLPQNNEPPAWIVFTKGLSKILSMPPVRDLVPGVKQGVVNRLLMKASVRAINKSTWRSIISRPRRPRLGSTLRPPTCKTAPGSGERNREKFLDNGEPQLDHLAGPFAPDGVAQWILVCLPWSCLPLGRLSGERSAGW